MAIAYCFSLENLLTIVDGILGCQKTLWYIDRIISGTQRTSILFTYHCLQFLLKVVYFVKMKRSEKHTDRREEEEEYE